MARMKIEVEAARHQVFGATLHKKLIANLPQIAPFASRTSGILNRFSRSRFLRSVSEPLTGLSRHRPVPEWSRNPYAEIEPQGPVDGQAVVLFADTFNTWFEPDNLRAAKTVLAASGYRVHAAVGASGRRTICCGRTYLTAGMIEEAKREVGRMLAALKPFLETGIPVVGLEPSCMLGMRDEIPALIDDPLAEKLSKSSFLFEEFIARQQPVIPFKPVPRNALVHGHCHQKSFDQMGGVKKALDLIPEMDVSVVDAGCCGMAGAFGYSRETYSLSQQMGELDLLPAVRCAATDTILIADGTSCRHQIELGTGRKAVHVAEVMSAALAD